jgi:hypothetical protein
MTLAEFLLARIGEDEAVAQGLTERDVFAPTQGPDMARVHEDDEYAALHVGAGRVLAECAAKRTIIELHGNGEAWCDYCADYGYNVDDRCVTVQALAAVYADHPDYQADWALDTAGES